MFERELKRFRSLVREGRSLFTYHALVEMDEDDLLEEDVESVILSGRIVERQIDRDTGERKYVLSGWDRTGVPAGVVVKAAHTDKIVVITAYREVE
jgi:hypothetical protein